MYGIQKRWCRKEKVFLEKQFFSSIILCAAVLTVLFWLVHPGAASGSTDLLPAPSPSTNWTAPLLTDSGRDSDLIYRFDGRQAANVPDHVVPQNLTDQFTIATWMKHGPSPGLRAEKETLLCSSDKTGEETISHVLIDEMTPSNTNGNENYWCLGSFY